MYVCVCVQTQLVIGNVQVNDQLDHAEFQVCFCRDLNGVNPSSEKRPFVQFLATRLFDHPDVVFYKLVSVCVQDFEVTVDDQWLSLATNWARTLKSGFKALPPAHVVDLHDALKLNQSDLLDCIGFRLDIERQGVSASAFYETIEIGTVSSRVSFRRSHAVDQKSRKDPLKRLSQSVDIVKNFESVLFLFQGKRFDHVFSSTGRLSSLILAHYQQAVMSQWYKVAGAARILGNPIGLYSSLEAGVTDFVHEPVAALVNVRNIAANRTGMESRRVIRAFDRGRKETRWHSARA
jgi:hypothetical protein